MRAIPDSCEGQPPVMGQQFSSRIASTLVGAAVLVLSASSGPSAADAMEPAANPVAAEYRTVISSMLEDHCYECHGDGHDKGKVAFDTLETDEQILKPDLWLRVLNNTRAGLMPAEQKPKLSPADQQKLERWIKYGVFKIDPQNPDPGRVTVRRLNRVEYRNTIRDLMNVDFDTEVEFPPDDTGYGFDNIGDVLTLSPMLMEKYVAAAQFIVGESVPPAELKPAEQVVAGAKFTGANTQVRGDKLRLSYLDAATASTTVTTSNAGNFEVVLDLDVRGNFIFDPSRCRVIFKLDGQEVLNREFAYFNERSFTFPSSHTLKAAEHQFSVELQPIPTTEKGPDDQAKNPTRLIISKLTVRGPLEKKLWVKAENYDRFFPRAIPQGRAERFAYARELLGAFAAKAYRRPLAADDDTPTRLAKLAEGIYRQSGKSFEQGVAHSMAAVLASPRFLFRLEEPAVHAPNARVADVDEYSLASRLSYFLWSTMPDNELMNLAAQGELRKNLNAQVKRMLADPRAEASAQNFVGQWLQARDVEGIASNAREIQLRDAGEEKTLEALRQAFRKGDEPTAKLLAARIDKIIEDKGSVELDGEMRRAMRRETEMYFSYVVSADRPVTELIDSDYTFLNDKLAKLYGLPAVGGTDLRRVNLPPGSARGGVLTQGTSLVVTSNPDRTSPVKRGLFVLANFLGTPPPPPPPNIPALEASDAGVAGHEPTLRESLLKHRENPSCASCHNRMDPIGLAFENFNALGMWRDTERKQPIVAPGKLITGETFDSVSELKKVLVSKHRQDFYRTLTDRLLIYATGRGTEYYDAETIDEIVQRLNANDGRFSAMLMGVIESAPFQKMRTQATVTAAN
jgi:mono/diheme cytochrome c family protein